jgi:hypothetical protein
MRETRSHFFWVQLDQSGSPEPVCNQSGSCIVQGPISLGKCWVLQAAWADQCRFRWFPKQCFRLRESLLSCKGLHSICRNGICGYINGVGWYILWPAACRARRQYLEVASIHFRDQSGSPEPVRNQSGKLATHDIKCRRGENKMG